MKIYLASSWKNEQIIVPLADMLREKGHEVDCFCDPSCGRFVFSFREIGNAEELNAINMLETKQAQKAFQEDKKWIEWCDMLIMVLPCGNSAHLEAGYAKGIGKEVLIVGSFPNGQWDVMYGFADRLMKFDDFINNHYLLYRAKETQ